MSLINDMLKDLDRDQADAAPHDPPLPRGLSASKQDKTSHLRRYALPALALLAMMYALLVEWNLLGLMPVKKPTEFVAPEPIALNSKWLKSQGEIDSPSTPAPTPTLTPPATTPSTTTSLSSTPIGGDKTLESNSAAEVTADSPANRATDMPMENSSEPAESGAHFYGRLAASGLTAAKEVEVVGDNSAAIDQLLDAAARALAANRLTTPVGDNAYHLYKSILVINPNHPEALAGITAIQQSYLDWLDRALSDGRLAAAHLYWQKARNVGVEADTLASYATALGNLTPSAQQKSVQSVKAPVADYSARIAPASTVDDGTMAARLHRDGLQKEQEALGLLNQSPAAQQTAVALADRYVERGAAEGLRRLQSLLQGQPAGDYVAAQLLVLSGQSQQAMERLAQTELMGWAEQQRLRLLAGLQQQAGQYSEAMQIYAELVTNSPENVADWLGLAVSSDKSKFTSTALNAYEKVLVLRHPDQRVMRFAQQRQHDLSISANKHR